MAIKKAYSLQLFTPLAISQIRIYICFPDRNYVQEDSCLPDLDSVREDLAHTTPLTHDDLGCPIRRDRLYQDTMGATAKPLSGPPVSPSLFRSARACTAERPSPKAIQASIKESATLAAAISMQWKEEVSAMRRELADLRRDLCKELRAFNSNFNTFTQHYNTWSPQGGTVAAGADVGFGRGTASRPELFGGRATVGLEAPAPDQGEGGTREKKTQVSKVSVGTQARSKALVRQSTADAAVNCPEEKEAKKSARKNLPKQLSMDPSILACPQSMYVESAIPLTLDPILPGSSKASEPVSAPTAVPSKTKAEFVTQHHVIKSPSDTASLPSGTPVAVPMSSETTPESPRNPENAVQETPITVEQPEPVNTDQSNAEASHSDPPKLLDLGVIKTSKKPLPYPVPVVTVSPPDDPDCEISDSEPPDPVTEETIDPKSKNTTAMAFSGERLEDQDDLNEPKVSDIPIDFDEPSCHNVVGPSIFETDIRCPSIVVSEYLDPDFPPSPTENDPSPDPIIALPDELPCPPSDGVTVASTPDSRYNDAPHCSETDSQDSEWPPLPEPLDTTPIYHADLVHFDLVMLTSLDQDDLDSVFMDPEPEPFGLDDDSQSVAEDVGAYCQSSTVAILDQGSLCSQDPSQGPDAAYVDPALDYCFSRTPQDLSPRVPLPQVSVTISPPSSVSPDTSVEMDFGPTSPVSPDRNPSTPESETLSEDLPQLESDEISYSALELSALPRDQMEFIEAESAIGPDRTSSEQAFLWCRWQKRTQRRMSMHRSASVELWSQRYEYNSAEITYVSLTL